MSLFVEADVKKRAQTVLAKSLQKTASRILVDSVESYSEAKTYDIFLSHSVRDADLVLGVKGILEDLGYSVYVDWIEDTKLDRIKVTSATAEVLRKRMQNSRSLFYITTSNAETSKWMPWECGYFDGFKEKVAIVPVVPTATGNTYQGQEYLGLYPYALKELSSRKVDTLWIHKDSKTYISYDAWVKTQDRNVQWKTI